MSDIDAILNSVEESFSADCDRDCIVNDCWNVIANPRATNRQRASAYNLLGCFNQLVEPSFDGGHHGLGWFTAALIHDPDCLGAMSNIVASFDAEDGRAGHQDVVLTRRCFDRLIEDKSEVGVRFREQLKDARYFRNLPNDWVRDP